MEMAEIEFEVLESSGTSTAEEEHATDEVASDEDETLLEELTMEDVAEAVAAAEPIAADVEPSEPSLAEELDQLRGAFGAEKSELVAKLNLANERIERMTEQAEERERIISGLEDEIKTAKESVEAFKTKLCNPAFAVAVEGEEEAAEDGGNGETGPSLLERLRAITDPKEKSKFRREHAEEMKEAMRELAGN